jgi:hypothetical protein
MHHPQGTFDQLKLIPHPRRDKKAYHWILLYESKSVLEDQWLDKMVLDAYIEILELIGVELDAAGQQVVGKYLNKLRTERSARLREHFFAQ